MTNFPVSGSWECYCCCGEQKESQSWH